VNTGAGWLVAFQLLILEMVCQYVSPAYMLQHNFLEMWESPAVSSLSWQVVAFNSRSD